MADETDVDTTPATPPPEKKEKPLWLTFFESASGPTLITVVLGGIFGTMITGMVQHMLKQREEARAEAAIVGKARLVTVQNAFLLTGRMIGAADDLIVTSGPEYDLTHYQGDELAKVVAEIHAIRDGYNTTDREWRTTCYSHGMLLAYFHPTREDVAARWTDLANAVSGYVDCARAWSVSHPQPTAYDGSCGKQQEKVEASIAEFLRAMRAGGE